MQLTIDRAALAAAVKLTKFAVATRTTLPVLAHYRLEAGMDGTLTVAATNLETFVAATVAADVVKAGAATAPADLLAPMLAQCAAPTLTLAHQKGRLRLSGERTNLALPSFDAEDFPDALLGGEAAPVATCPVAALREAAGRAAIAAARDDSRPVLAGVLFEADGERLTLAAADGFRLAVDALPVARPEGAEAVSFIVPAKPLTALLGALPDGEVAIGLARTLVEFAVPGRAVARLRMIEGAFPAWRMILPASFARVARAPREALRDAARLAALAGYQAGAAHGAPPIVRLDLAIGPDTVVVSGSDEAEAEVAVPLLAPVGDARRVSLNAAYLIEALGALPGGVAELRANEASQVVVVAPGEPDAGTLHGIMPINPGGGR